MRARTRGIQLFLVALLALTMLVHCGADRSLQGDESPPSTTTAAATCAGQWDPSWQQGSGANNWWVEYAISGGTVASAHLEVVGVGDVPLSLAWNKWVGPASFRIAAGTPVIVHAVSSGGQEARTNVFGYLAAAEPLTDCTCASGACGGGACSGWSPTWQQGSGAGNWWVEYAIADGSVASAYLEVVGGRNIPLSQAWGKWVGPTGARIETGTSVIVHATNGAAQSAQTKAFGYLVDTAPLTECAGQCTPSCAGHTCGDDGCGGSCGACASGQTCASGTCTGGGACSGWTPTWQQGSGAGNWWAEYAIADGSVASAYLEVVGVRNVPLSQAWGKWVGPTGARIETGTSVIVHATNAAAQSAQTKSFGYLVDTAPLTACAGQCTPSCAGHSCGDDGCGGSCGTCASGQTCASGTCTGGGGSAPAVRYVGRSDMTDPDHPKFGWPGARIIARFSGTAVNVTLNEESLYTGPSRWDVLVDGARTFTLAPAAGLGTYSIASALPNAVHTIELYKRSEGMVGVTQFMGYAFPSGGQLLAPPAAPPRRIEFLGDSTTNGYGNECSAPTEAFSGATENERLAFSGLVAHDLDADHHDISVSGKGVLLNYHRDDPVVFDQLFTRANPNQAAPAWIFSGFTPDVVWMNLGGNDWDQESAATPAPDLGAYTNKYLALAENVRARYPNAILFCSVTPSLNDVYPVGWNVLSSQRTAITNVVNARTAAGDTKIFKYEFSRAVRDTDLTGCGYHTNLGLHRRMADEVIVQIRAKTGWL